MSSMKEGCPSAYTPARFSGRIPHSTPRNISRGAHRVVLDGGWVSPRIGGVGGDGNDHREGIDLDGTQPDPSRREARQFGMTDIRKSFTPAWSRTLATANGNRLATSVAVGAGSLDQDPTTENSPLPRTQFSNSINTSSPQTGPAAVAATRQHMCDGPGTGRIHQPTARDLPQYRDRMPARFEDALVSLASIFGRGGGLRRLVHGLMRKSIEASTSYKLREERLTACHQ